MVEVRQARDLHFSGPSSVTVAAVQDREGLARAVLLPNKHALPPSRVPPSFLLRSGFAVVPFRSRGTELSDLLSWCVTDENPIGLRLCVAPGGQGKTRLAQELGVQLERRGWLAGRVRAHYDRTALTRLLDLPDDLLLVVDYAETAQGAVQHLAELLTQPAAPRARRRVLLLARSRAGWWEALRGRLPDEIAVSAFAPPYELPLLFGEAADRAAEFQMAVQRFARVGGYPDDDVPLPRDLADDRFGHALTLHMTALAALLDHNDTFPPGARRAPTEDDPAARVMEHERWYWSDTATAAGLPDVQTGRLPDAVMLMATCAGAETREEAITLLSHLPDLSGEHRRLVGRYADWAHNLQFGEQWLNALEPDLLAEYFLARTLHDEQPELSEALADAVSTVDQRANTVWTLARVASRYPDAATALTRLFLHGSDKLWLTGAVLVAYLPDPQVLTGPLRESLASIRDPKTLRDAARELPGSYRVADLKIAIAVKALDRYHELRERDDAAEAGLLDAIAEGLYYADQFDEAEQLMPQLLKRFGRLAKQDPRRHLEGMARAHLSYGAILLDKDNKKALGLAKEAQDLAAALPAAAQARVLARAHDLRSQALHRSGDNANALLEAQKAVKHGATAAQSDEWSRQWQPMFLMNLANRYSDRGKHEQALDVMSDVIGQLREMEGRQADSLWPNMNMALLNYAQCLQACGRTPEARQAIADAARKVRQLARIRPNSRNNLFQIAMCWRSYLLGCSVLDPQVRAEHEYIIDMLAELADMEPTAASAYADAVLAYAAMLARAGDHAAARQWRNKAARLHSDAKPRLVDADMLWRARDFMRDTGTGFPGH